jgi:hypothetical protein
MKIKLNLDKGHSKNDFNRTISVWAFGKSIEARKGLFKHPDLTDAIDTIREEIFKEGVPLVGEIEIELSPRYFRMIQCWLESLLEYEKSFDYHPNTQREIEFLEDYIKQFNNQ